MSRPTPLNRTAIYKLIAAWACALLVVQPVVMADGLWARPVHAQDESAQPAIHIVQVGETLSQIAQLYQVSQADLMRINGIQNANAIYVGQELLLPPNDATSTPADELGETPLLPSASHTVQRGETLRAIADAYDVDIIELMTINFISDADSIYVGQVLELPVPAVDDSNSAAEDTNASTTDDAAVQSVPAAEAVTAEADTPAAETEPDAPATEAAENSAAADEAATAAEEDAEPIDRTAMLNQTYTVQAGDTPGRVALRTGVSLDALLALNRLGAYDVLSAEQMLILPATFAELQVAGASQTTDDASSPNADLNIHMVEYGETLNMIAQEYGVTLPALMTANLLRNPDMISVGQALRIPDPDEEQPADASAADNTAEVTKTIALPELSLPLRGYYYYTVQPGDTTAKIALQFGSTPLAIKEFNGLPSEETVYVGLELQIPYGPPPLPGTRPRAPVSGTSFVVSLSRQQCWVLRGERVLYTWLCSTGYGQWTTRTGSFAVQTRLEVAKSYGLALDMPYWLGIYDVGPYENGIHGLPIRWDTGEKIWEGLIGRPATYGCAMLDDIQAEQLFALSFLGMPVYIVD
ncbi:MAG: LysM peptidoglycan-binding domain-containing protein [Caldilineaceae bacterium]